MVLTNLNHLSIDDLVMLSTKRQIGIRIPHELDRRLEEHVAKIGISKSAFILSILYKELTSIGKEEEHGKQSSDFHS